MKGAQSKHIPEMCIDQIRLPQVCNRPLLMEDIDRNFGSVTGEPNRRLNLSSSRDGSDSLRSSHVHGSRSGGRLYDSDRGRSGR